MWFTVYNQLEQSVPFPLLPVVLFVSPIARRAEHQDCVRTTLINNLVNPSPNAYVSIKLKRQLTRSNERFQSSNRRSAAEAGRALVFKGSDSSFPLLLWRPRFVSSRVHAFLSRGSTNGSRPLAKIVSEFLSRLRTNLPSFLYQSSSELPEIH